jgi:hypothetical protein
MNPLMLENKRLRKMAAVTQQLGVTLLLAIGPVIGRTGRNMF